MSLPTVRCAALPSQPLHHVVPCTSAPSPRHVMSWLGVFVPSWRATATRRPIPVPIPWCLQASGIGRERGSREGQEAQLGRLERNQGESWAVGRHGGGGRWRGIEGRGLVNSRERARQRRPPIRRLTEPTSAHHSPTTTASFIRCRLATTTIPARPPAVTSSRLESHRTPKSQALKSPHP